MGPRSERARKAPWRRGAGRAGGRFNGAALGKSAESRLAVARVAFRHRLQWGRARKERGKHSPCRSRSPRSTASMGPRSERARKGRGSSICSSSTAQLQWGRARKERGKRPVPVCPFLAVGASMGPRSERARKVAQSVACLVTRFVLQWGRARKERGKEKGWHRGKQLSESFNGAALGKSAERREVCPSRAGHNLASMGPRSERARKALRRLGIAWAPEASMGPRSERARKVARLARKKALGVCFNGAALGKSAERRRDGHAARAHVVLQWGRARKERGKSSPSAINSSAVSASMGPRSERARKDRHGVAAATTRETLQWGRARKERGKQVRHRVLQAEPGSFNGAALGKSAERRSARHHA